MGIVYKITNTVNQKLYIGQTTKSIKQRFQAHSNPTSQTRLSNSIKKYGKTNFSIEPLHETEDKSMLNLMEMHFIALYNTTAPNGYNMTYGGDSAWANRVSSPMTGKKHSDETRAKMSKAALGKSKSLEARLKMSKAKKGIKHSIETLKKMIKSRTGLNYKGNKVKDLVTGEIYKSVTLAARSIGISRRTMIRWLNRQCYKQITIRYQYLGE